MIQEKIEGDGIGIFAFFDNGKPVAIFSHRRIREKPPWGGVSVLCESTEPDPAAKEFSIRLLKNLKWSGVAMVEFKRDNSEGGIPKLMEINARLWGSLQLAVNCGIDFPYLLYLQSNGIAINSISKYQYRRLRWLLGDIDNLYLSIKYGDLKSGVFFYLTNCINCFFDFISEFQKKTDLEIFKRKDIKPFLWELKNYLFNLIR